MGAAKTDSRTTQYPSWVTGHFEGVEGVIFCVKTELGYQAVGIIHTPSLEIIRV